MSLVSDLTITGLIWYYFNILCIAGIIFFVMLIAYNRAKRPVINIGEGSAKEQKFPPFIKKVAIFGVVFFAVREWGDDIYEFSTAVIETIGDKIDG